MCIYVYLLFRIFLGWTRAVALTCFLSLTLSCLAIILFIGLLLPYYKKIYQRRNSRQQRRFNDPDYLRHVDEIRQDIMTRISAPPLYDVAMATSQPFNEAVNRQRNESSRSDLPAYSDALNANANVHAFLAWNPALGPNISDDTNAESSYVVIENSLQTAVWSRRGQSDADAVAEERSLSSSDQEARKESDTVSEDLININATLGAVDWNNTGSSSCDVRSQVDLLTSPCLDGLWSNWDVSAQVGSVASVVDVAQLMQTHNQNDNDDDDDDDDDDSILDVSHTDDILALL